MQINSPIRIHVCVLQSPFSLGDEEDEEEVEEEEEMVLQQRREESLLRSLNNLKNGLQETNVCY